MMKKFLMFLILFLLPMTVSAETTYSSTLENGRLILVDGGMGVGRYADRSSVTAQMYDPPIYQLSIKVYSVEFSDEYYREHGTYIGSPYKINSDFVMDCQFKYDWNSKMLYVLNNGIWRDWNVYEEHSHADGDPLFPNSAEVAFVTNYGMKFFGGVKKYSKYTDQYYDVIDSDLYVMFWFIKIRIPSIITLTIAAFRIKLSIVMIEHFLLTLKNFTMDS